MKPQMTQMTQIKEHPILFSGTMVRAILDGSKTMTRRVMKPQPEIDTAKDLFYFDGITTSLSRLNTPELPMMVMSECRYGKPGDIIYVRETFCQIEKKVYYKESSTCLGWQKNYTDVNGTRFKGWKPSIHMPRWASRITLEIVSIRAERLHEITEADILKEGVQGMQLTELGWRYAFGALWNSINEKRGFGWDLNPWVWVIEFKRIQDHHEGTKVHEGKAGQGCC